MLSRIEACNPRHLPGGFALSGAVSIGALAALPVTTAPRTAAVTAASTARPTGHPRGLPRPFSHGWVLCNSHNQKVLPGAFQRRGWVDSADPLARLHQKRSSPAGRRVVGSQ
jgi:hypothetical protein